MSGNKNSYEDLLALFFWCFLTVASWAAAIVFFILSIIEAKKFMFGNSFIYVFLFVSLLSLAASLTRMWFRK